MANVINRIVADVITSTTVTSSGHLKADGYTIDLSAGATTNQVLQYNGTSFIAGTVSGGGMSIGGAVTSGTSKSVLFVDGSSNLAQDNSNFAWDSSTHSLGLGTASPGYELDIRGSADSSLLHLASNGAGDKGLYINAESGGFTLAGGAARTSGSWTAKHTTAHLIDIDATANTFDFYSNTGLTIGNTYSPTKIASISSVLINIAGRDIKPNQTTPSQAQALAWDTGVSAYIPQTISSAITIGNAIGSATNNRVLYADGSGNLGDTLLSLTSSELGPVTDNAVSLGDSSHRFVDGYFAGKLALDGYTIDLSAGATTNQVLQYNGTKFVAATVSGGSGTFATTYSSTASDNIVVVTSGGGAVGIQDASTPIAADLFYVSDNAASHKWFESKTNGVAMFRNANAASAQRALFIGDSADAFSNGYGGYSGAYAPALQINGVHSSGSGTGAGHYLFLSSLSDSVTQALIATDKGLDIVVNGTTPLSFDHSTGLPTIGISSQMSTFKGYLVGDQNYAAPTFTTRSAGTKFITYNALGGSSMDWAIGIEGAAQWYSIQQATNSYSHRFYGGITKLLDIWGDGKIQFYGTTAAAASGSFRYNSGNSKLQLCNDGSTWVDVPTSGDNTLAFSIVDAAAQTAGDNQAAAGGTLGQMFSVTRACTITGARFFWSGPNKTIRVALWNSTGTAAATVDVNTTGTAIYTATFSSPVSISGTDLFNTQFFITHSDQSNTHYERLVPGNIALPGSSSSGFGAAGNNNNAAAMNGLTIQVRGYNFYHSSINTKPNTGGTGVNAEYYPIDPTYTVP